ncbi:hypothetical protein BKK79_00015 [Cupriavidus sp. USMAA2-4]|uniref:hypothetical protein n=1 Tax=Cupriavidus sp. USMAA2-4 TaxID=876364 RepID=UPI0008A7107A|nr:hypothetical protein [Cupriavidus sp. USMAA2-4]AOY90389.1 hypothetical protein BKK79_00015 [Cupriavidus sp. USMAA2-4]
MSAFFRPQSLTARKNSVPALSSFVTMGSTPRPISAFMDSQAAMKSASAPGAVFLNSSIVPCTPLAFLDQVEIAQRLGLLGGEVRRHVRALALDTRLFMKAITCDSSVAPARLAASVPYFISQAPGFSRSIFSSTMFFRAVDLICLPPRCRL